MADFRVIDRRASSGEIRDPRFATQPRTFVTPQMPMIPQWDAEQAILRAYYANIFVYRCVQVTANAIAKWPIRIGADPDKPQSYRKDGTFARMFSKPPGGPNPTTSARKLIAWSIAQRLVCGRLAYEYDFDDADRIVGVWPLPAPRIVPEPTKAGSTYWAGFTWTDTSGNWRHLPPETVFYSWIPSANDWREPESPLQAARLDVSTAIMQTRYDFAFLRNGGMPAAMVVGPMFGDSAEREAFERQWRAGYGGVDNAGKVAFGYSDVPSPLDAAGGKTPAWDVKVLGLAQKDSQAIERQKDLAARICAVFGTPMSKVGDSSERTFSNAAQEDINWNRETLIPYGDDYIDDLNIQLAPRLGSDVAWFDKSDVDALESRNWVAVPITDLFDRGIANANWVADETGIPREEMGTPVDPNEQAVAQKELAKSGAGPTPKRISVDLAGEGEPLAASAEDIEREQREIDEYAGASTGTEKLHKYWTAGPGLAKWRHSPHPWTALYHHLRKYIHPDDFAKRTAAQWFHEVMGIWPGTPHAKPGDETYAMPMAEIFKTQRARAWNDMDKRATALESQFEIEMRALFVKQRDEVLSRLEGRRGKASLRAAATGDEPVRVPPADAVFSQTHWQDETAKTSAQLYRSIATVAGTSIADKLGTAFNIHADKVARFIRDRANKLAESITKSTYSDIHAQLTEGVNAGESIPQLAKRIRHLFQVASDTRARTIARTEVISAYNGASEATVSSYGADVVGGKEWIATNDNRTREDHRHADGQIRGLAEPFVVGGIPMTYPGDPIAPANEVVNCRCTIGFLTPQDMADRGVSVRSTPLQPDEVRRLFTLIEGGQAHAV